MRRCYFLLLIVLLIPSAQTTAQDTIATQILNRVNEARTSSNVIALQFNSQLQAAAQQHSNDMASVDQLSHVGTNGSQFWERIQANSYTLIIGAENILSRPDTNADAAFTQWFNSESHRNNMLNGAYSEVGIAYSRAASGRIYFTMVLANRADFVVPTQRPMPTNTAIPPTNTTIPATHTPMPTQMLVPTTQPTSTPTQITATQSVPSAQVLVTNTPLPTATAYIAPDIRLIYDDNSFLMINVSGQVRNLANLVFESDSGVMSATRWNTEFLSQPLSGFTTGDCVQAWTFDVNYIQSPTECRYRHGWIAVADDVTFWKNTNFFTVRNGDELVGICRVDEQTCDVNISTPIDDLSVVDPVLFGQIPDLRLEYPDSSFSLINVAGRTLDLTGLVFRSESGTLAIGAWDNGFLTQSLSMFENGGCLQAWTPDYPNQIAPTRCEIRHAWILLNDAEDFWRQTDNFTLERDGIILGRCRMDTTSCSISLSNNAGIAIPPTITNVTSQPMPTTSNSVLATSDLQLIITNQSVTLLNTSSQVINIESIVLESPSGTFTSIRWQIPQLTVPLSALPTGDCVQVWGVGTLEQMKPSACTVRHAWVAAVAYEQFWMNTNTFNIYQSGVQIASCETRVMICNINLP